MGIHVMLDLETFGDTNNAAIISIGAVKFNATDILDRFHVGVDPDSSQIAGDITASTVMWWLDPERAAAWAEWQKLEKVDLWLALAGFADWYRNPPLAENGEIPFDPPAHEFGAQLPIWGNGATFDNVILRSAYDAVGQEHPAPFWLDRCYRSVKALRPDIKLERVGTHHSAVDDAESQARHLQAIWAALGVEHG